jgi:hypothetical protein
MGAIGELDRCMQLRGTFFFVYLIWVTSHEAVWRLAVWLAVGGDVLFVSDGVGL